MPNFDENNVHSVEFQAPLSTDSASAAKKHFSIDLSLELERQLDMESFPPTPAHPADSHPGSSGNSNAPNRDSLDPHVLAHIVKQLQQSLAEVTKDRDELREAIALSHSHEAELQDALQHMIDKATTMEVELSDARKRIKDDEEAIALLRTKVEESRRGLMRLQTESRRQSLAPVDVTRASFPSFGSPPSSKRASFTPLTGSVTARPSHGHGHRRIASVSGSPTHDAFLERSPNAQTLTFPDNVTSPYAPSATRRHSGLFGRTSPSQPEVASSDHLSSELDQLRKELRAVKDELEITKHELRESNEAKEASEMCVKALREFIGENNIGGSDAETSSVTSLKLPPPPTMAKGDEEVESKKTAGWGFKLWGDSSSSKPSPIVPQSATMTPPSAPSPQMPMSATPLSRKIGGFFSSRTPSISSMAPTTTTVPPLQSNAGSSIRESTYSASDTSSVVEPASPPNEYSNLNVVVRDATNLSDSSAGNSPDLSKEMPVHAPPRQGIVVS
ncbi:hypothetical protein LshimejAT787_1303390 [Lyophyllum shimeji]|uniref:Uncharacterized protein n=1 Tax=Lyophyllum shimeji TaxID=47721 RepID=A0A9P3PWU4_LYOSH|nr:hypothetical protein LshimejAT787_1303390 [Lyophyllum shimeji]